MKPSDHLDAAEKYVGDYAVDGANITALRTREAVRSLLAWARGIDAKLVSESERVPSADPPPGPFDLTLPVSAFTPGTFDPQPATGDGTGEDEGARRMYDEIISTSRDDCWAELTVGKKRDFREAFRFARDMGRREVTEAWSRESAEKRELEGCVEELKEKLAAAEADSERWAKETLELQELVERNAERAEKAEARVAATEILVTAALHWYNSRVDDEWAGEKLVQACYEHTKAIEAKP